MVAGWGESLGDLGATGASLEATRTVVAGRCEHTSPKRTLRVAGLFAGIGGFELGLEQAGHETVLLCEIDPAATAVLEAHFPNISRKEDIRNLGELPTGVDLLTAGFPCQDLSQAGRARGIDGHASGMVRHVFEVLSRQPVPWLLLENVPFMLQLGKGRALEVIVSELERLGYRWAYRIIDSRAFGLPQRRLRVFLVASLNDDPRRVLLADDAGQPPDTAARKEDWKKVACGFYWTEGWRGLGWAVDCVPTLKGGSGLGIPSPPAILLPSGAVVKPHIRDAERLQGFDSDWTAPAEQIAGKGHRWRLVGNAVTVNVAQWLGERLAAPSQDFHGAGRSLQTADPWPRAAWNVGNGRFAFDVSTWPVRRPSPSLHEFLRHEPEPLSAKATAGFLQRARSKIATIRCDPTFLAALDRHLEGMQSQSP